MDKMQSNIEFLDTYGVLGDIRDRYGATDEHDTSKDAEINALTARELTKAYAGYQLGDPGWADTLIDLYEAAQREAAPRFTANIGDLRVWYIINMPSDPVYIPVRSVEHGMEVIAGEAKKQLKDSRVVNNMFGLEVFLREDDQALLPTWNEWESSDGEHIDEYTRSLEEKNSEVQS